MKNIAKAKSALMTAIFLKSAVLSSFAVILVKYYIQFLEQTAGSYNIAMLFGEPLRSFLIKVLFIAAGLIAFAVFMIKAKFKNNAVLSNGFIIATGALLAILPLLSVYTISRFTGYLIIQTVSGIAIIANVVFMMVSVLCASIAVIDIIHNILQSNQEDRANQTAMLMAGIPFGCGCALLIGSVLGSAAGLGAVYVLFGVLAVVIGIVNYFINKKSGWG